MKGILIEPGRKRSLIEIDNTLEALQEIVDGRIETITLTGDIVAVVNEEGRILGLPYCCTIKHISTEYDLIGPVLFLGYDGDEFTDIPEEVV